MQLMMHFGHIFRVWGKFRVAVRKQLLTTSHTATIHCCMLRMGVLGGRRQHAV